MALTMTRTRTQTALTKMVELLANVNGELEFLDRLMAQEHLPEIRRKLEARKEKLSADKEALFAAIRQFDPGLEPATVGARYEWQKKYGPRRLPLPTIRLRYLAQFLQQEKLLAR